MLGPPIRQSHARFNGESSGLGETGFERTSGRFGEEWRHGHLSLDQPRPDRNVLDGHDRQGRYNLDKEYWRKTSNQSDSIPFLFYWNADDSVARLRNIETKILPMATYYSTLFGEYPFEKGGFATIEQEAGFIWGGMENQTLISLEYNGWDEDLVSHEFAHHWFGDMISPGTWADVWLNEGFATYCEALWDQHNGGYTAYKNTILLDASYYLSENPGSPIYNQQWAVVTPDISTMFNGAITYYKGACVLHMLRYVLGDSLFFLRLKVMPPTRLIFG